MAIGYSGEDVGGQDDGRSDAERIMGYVHERALKDMRNPKNDDLPKGDDLPMGPSLALLGDSEVLQLHAAEPTIEKLLFELGRRTDSEYYLNIGRAAARPGLLGYEEPSNPYRGIKSRRGKSYEPFPTAHAENTRSGMPERLPLENQYVNPQIIYTTDRLEGGYDKPVIGTPVEQWGDEEITAEVLQRIKAAKSAGRASLDQGMLADEDRRVDYDSCSMTPSTILTYSSNTDIARGLGLVDLNAWDRPDGSDELK